MLKLKKEENGLDQLLESVALFLKEPNSSSYYSLLLTTRKVLNESDAGFEKTVIEKLQKDEDENLAVVRIILSPYSKASRKDKIAFQMPLFSKIFNESQTNPYAWNNLGFTFSEGATVDNLLEDFPANLKKEMQGKDQASLKAFCYGKAIIHQTDHATAWNNLGTSFSQGATVEDLPEDFPKELKEAMKGRNKASLRVFCYGQAIIHQPDHAGAWYNLGVTFSQGATVDDLPEDFPADLKTGMQEKDQASLKAFCYGKAIIHQTDHATAWHNLGFAFSNGATVDDLPDGFFTSFVKTLAAHNEDAKNWFTEHQPTKMAKCIAKEIDRQVKKYIKQQDKVDEAFKNDLWNLIQFATEYFEKTPVKKNAALKLMLEQAFGRWEALLYESLNQSEAVLGAYFRLQRGSSKPSFDSGCLYEIKVELQKFRKPAKKDLNTRFFQGIIQDPESGLLPDAVPHFRV